MAPGDNRARMARIIDRFYIQLYFYSLCSLDSCIRKGCVKVTVANPFNSKEIACLLRFALLFVTTLLHTRSVLSLLSSPHRRIITMASKSLSQKAELIGRVLDRYYPNPPIPLNHINDFTFLIAVVLSAQTTDGKVNQVTKELFLLADSPEKMSAMSTAEVLRIIQPVGLAPRKAQYVVGIAKTLVEKFNSTVPGSYEELESLPGVGHKTASVIMSQLHKV
ncbi:MAG: hypothetical protein EOO94_00100 [Pedobacter sp.]|nr:MAG: hypothetical protein EOO94_00100 [Pedobacter sp.]